MRTPSASGLRTVGLIRRACYGGYHTAAVRGYPAGEYSLEDDGSVANGGELVTCIESDHPDCWSRIHRACAAIRDGEEPPTMPDRTPTFPPPVSTRSMAGGWRIWSVLTRMQFATKSAVLKEVVETAIVGDDEAVPAAGRSWFLDVVALTDLDQKLRGSGELRDRRG